MSAAKYTRREFMRVTGAGIAAAGLGFPAVVRAAASGEKSVIVLGIDGMDPGLVERYVREGRMPNTARLIEQGSFSRLRTTDPPQSPVAWSTFISGTHPGGHGIFDFIAREPSTLLPYLSTSRIEPAKRTITIGHRVIPVSHGKALNLRQGATFWNDLEDHGIDCTVIKMPANFPPTPSRARTLSGLGTPDLMGSYGIFSFYTDKATETTRDVSGGRIEKVAVRENIVRCTLGGPVNSFDPAGNQTSIPFTVYLDPANPAALVSIAGRELFLREGDWSDWLPVSFPMAKPFAAADGMCRLFLKKARDDFALYVSPVNIDPANPELPISTPPRYSRELARAVGRFYTQGMPEDTSALSAGVLDDSRYREQARLVLDERLKLFEHAFGRFSRGFYFFYFSSLDLNSHAFWRTLDPGHPLYTPKLASEHGDFIPWLYSQMDSVIGQAMKRLDPDTTLIVMSDHGFGSFRRQFNLNTWLLDNRYASALPGASRGSAGFFADIDWTGTRAYGLGINSLYLNIRGREPDGTVNRGAEAESLKEELARRLTAVTDPKTGQPVVTNVYRPEKIYPGPHLDTAPDLIVCYNRNYRASWDTVLGKYPMEQLLDNTDPWSGDHTVDSQFVPGVLISNLKPIANSPGLEDLAPSILGLFGAPVPGTMTGRRCVS